MKPTRLLSEDDAVSPVIGVILMVAITVIMAAIVGAFVLSLQAGTAVAPQASWDVTAEDTGGSDAIDHARITHRAGERVLTENLRVQVPTAASAVYGADGVAVGDRIDVQLEETTAGGSVSSGPAGDQLLLVWRESPGGESTVLTSYTFTRAYGHNALNATVQ